ncbi:MAG: putative inorganic carbon (HCO3(-)) transporter [Saprospiraceae bacterium]|jgi:putative inorganic carbon (HCO3(-)) transporter
MSAITNGLQSISDLLYRSFLPEKLNNPLGYILCILFALFIAAVFALLPLKIAIIFVGLMVGIPLMGVCFVELKIGVGFIMIFGFFVIIMGKYVDAPFGIGLDVLLFVLMFSLIVQISKTKDISFAKHPISYFILAWIGYSLFQVLNPSSESLMAWLYTVRSLAGLLFLYFIASYAFTSKKIIFNSIKIILGLGLVAALYGLKQEFMGFSSTELAWVNADPKRYQLIVQWSRMRIFSLFSDPTTYGILSAYMGVMCMIIATGPYNWIKRSILIFTAIVSMMGMAYAGSRTPFVLVPVGIFFYVLMTLNRYVILASVAGFLMFGVLMVKSTSNPVIYRMQSAFKPGEDASMQVRIDNQARVQPFIHSHPIGAGLGSTGAWGARFTPDSWLASFAHDSGFVRIAVEAGWLGLILYMAMLFTIMRYGIYYYFRVHDPAIKNMYLAITTAFFILILASYPQEAIVMLPTSLVFYILLAALVRMKDFDEGYQAVLREKEASKIV